MKIDKIDSIIGIDHIGYAVNDIDSAKKIFNAIGYEFSETRADDQWLSASAAAAGECVPAG